MSTNTVVVKNKKACTAARVRNLIIDILIWAILIVVSLLCLLPFIHLLS